MFKYDNSILNTQQNHFKRSSVDSWKSVWGGHVLNGGERRSVLDSADVVPLVPLVSFGTDWSHSCWFVKDERAVCSLLMICLFKSHSFISHSREEPVRAESCAPCLAGWIYTVGHSFWTLCTWHRRNERNNSSGFHNTPPAEVCRWKIKNVFSEELQYISQAHSFFSFFVRVLYDHVDAVCFCEWFLI